MFPLCSCVPNLHNHILPGRKRNVGAAAAGGLSDLIHLSVLLIPQIYLAQSVVWEQQLQMGRSYLISPAILVILQSCVARGKHTMGAAVAGGPFQPYFSSVFIYPASCLVGSVGAVATGGLSEYILSPANRFCRAVLPGASIELELQLEMEMGFFDLISPPYLSIKQGFWPGGIA